MPGNLINIDNENTFTEELEKLRPITPITLPRIFKAIIDNGWKDRGVRYTQAFAREDVDGPVITWKTYRRVPGRAGLESLKPRMRGTFEGEDSTLVLEQHAQWFTVIYQFDIYHTSNPLADRLMENFEELLVWTIPLLKQLGVSEWLFLEQDEDAELGRTATQEIYRRTIRYHCIIEKKIIKPVPTIQSILLKTNVSFAKATGDEAIVRNGDVAYDLLSKRWATSTLYVTKDSNPAGEGYPSQQYLEGLDFKITVNMLDGKSYIEWLPNRDHPLPGETYYVTYFYKEVDKGTYVT